MELWANSGPLKDCWSCIILPMDGSLPNTPPFQYSDCAPVAKNWKTNKKSPLVTTQGKLPVLNTPAETYSHMPLTIIFSPSADLLTPLCAVVLNCCLSKVNENLWHQRLRVFPNICCYTDCSYLNPFHVIKFLIQHIQGFVHTSSLLKT